MESVKEVVSNLELGLLSQIESIEKLHTIH